MRIVRPFTVTNTALVSSTVPETPPAVYNAGTTYADGDRVSVLQADGYTYKVYESVAGSNTGHAVTDAAWWFYLADTYAEYNAGTTYAVNVIVISTATNRAYQSLQAANVGHSLSDAAWWLDLGPTNRFKMFDNSNTSQTVNAEVIDVTINVTGRANSVSLLNISAATLQVIVSTALDGEIYNETVNLIASSTVTNWWEYYFEPISRYGDWTLANLPSYNNPTIRVILTAAGDVVKIGSLVTGLQRDIGEVVYPSSIGIQDYSRKDTDEFGNYTIVKRNFAKRANLKVAVQEGTVDAISTILADLRATPIVVIGVENYRSTWIYGFYKDWEWRFDGANESYLALEIEGLT